MPTETPGIRPAAVAGGAAPAAPRRAGAEAAGLALAVIATAQLMVILDLTVVTVALPHMQRALGLSGPNLEWVVNAYAVAFGGLLPLGGRSGDLLSPGSRRSGESSTRTPPAIGWAVSEGDLNAETR